MEAEIWVTHTHTHIYIYTYNLIILTREKKLNIYYLKFHAISDLQVNVKYSRKVKLYIDIKIPQIPTKLYKWSYLWSGKNVIDVVKVLALKKIMMQMHDNRKKK